MLRYNAPPLPFRAEHDEKVVVFPDCPMYSDPPFNTPFIAPPFPSEQPQLEHLTPAIEKLSPEFAVSSKIEPEPDERAIELKFVPAWVNVALDCQEINGQLSSWIVSNWTEAKEAVPDCNNNNDWLATADPSDVNVTDCRVSVPETENKVESNTPSETSLRVIPSKVKRPVILSQGFPEPMEVN